MPSLQQYVDQATSLMGKRSFAQARDMLAPLAADDSVAAGILLPILLKLASCHDELGEYEQALQVLARALAIDGESTPAWNMVGIVCGRLERHEEALEAFVRAHESDPGNAALLVNLGSVAMKLGDLDAAKSWLDTAIEMDATLPAAHANLALVMLLFGRIEDAEECLRLAVFYGFTGADAIQDRIERMRLVREEVAGRMDLVAPGSPEVNDIMLDDARNLLALLEQNRDQLAASRRTADGLEDVEAQLTALDTQIAALKQRISSTQ
jgi:predicted Zn-dependent protease